MLGTNNVVAKVDFDSDNDVPMPQSYPEGSGEESRALIVVPRPGDLAVETFSGFNAVHSDLANWHQRYIESTSMDQGHILASGTLLFEIARRLHNTIGCQTAAFLSTLHIFDERHRQERARLVTVMASSAQTHQSQLAVLTAEATRSEASVATIRAQHETILAETQRSCSARISQSETSATARLQGLENRLAKALSEQSLLVEQATAQANTSWQMRLDVARQDATTSESGWSNANVQLQADLDFAASAAQRVESRAQVQRAENVAAMETLHAQLLAAKASPSVPPPAPPPLQPLPHVVVVVPPKQPRSELSVISEVMSQSSTVVDLYRFLYSVSHHVPATDWSGPPQPGPGNDNNSK